MAKHYNTFQEFKNAYPLELSQDDIKSGDILFFSGEYFFSKVAKFISGRTPWTHVAFVMDLRILAQGPLPENKDLNSWLNGIDFDQINVLKNPSPLFIVESVWPKGVSIQSLDKSFYNYEGGRKYNGKIAVCSFMESENFNFSNTQFRDFFYSTLGEKWGAWDVLLLGIDYLILKYFNRFKKRKKNIKPPYNCSEFVYYATKYSTQKTVKPNGYDLNSPNGFLVPESLWADSIIEPKGELILKKPKTVKFSDK